MVALYGIATKLVLPIVPLSSTYVRTVTGNKPAFAATAASAGLNEIITSISPSFINCRCAGPFSGNWSAVAPEIGRSASYQVHSGAVTARNSHRRRFLQTGGIGSQLVQRLFQERGAEEIAHAGMRETARMTASPTRGARASTAADPSTRSLS